MNAKAVMIAGDSDGFGTVGNSDISDFWETNAGTRGYLGSDLNLDTEVDNLDKNDFWLPNYNTATTVPE